MVLIGACTQGSEPSTDSARSQSQPAKGSTRPILSPAPTPTPGPHKLSFCPIGIQRAQDIPASEVVDAMQNHVPTWSPSGFGLVGAWTEGPPGGRAIWADRRCREVTVTFAPSTALHKERGPRIGAWTVTTNVRNACGNAILGGGRCLEYQATASDGVVYIQAMGIGRRIGDKIALSIPL